MGEVRVGSNEAVWCSRNGVRLAVNGETRMFDYVVCAVPPAALISLLPRTVESEPLRTRLCRFETSPITGVHLWFDRRISDLDHAVLLERTIQWMFHKSRIFGRAENGSYVELVISASKSLVQMPRQEIIDLAVRELSEFFPIVKEAKLLKATVVKEVHATTSPLPGADAHRPSTETEWPRLFLAGDWTATGWPATMESAVRSGYRAAEAVCGAEKREQKFVVPDLPASACLRFLGW